MAHTGPLPRSMPGPRRLVPYREGVVEGSDKRSVPGAAGGSVTVPFPRTTARALELVGTGQLDRMKDLLGANFSTKSYLKAIEATERSQASMLKAQTSVARAQARSASVLAQRTRDPWAVSGIGKRAAEGLGAQRSPFASIAKQVLKTVKPSLVEAFTGPERVAKDALKLAAPKFDVSSSIGASLDRQFKVSSIIGTSLDRRFDVSSITGASLKGKFAVPRDAFQIGFPRDAFKVAVPRDAFRVVGRDDLLRRPLERWWRGAPQEIERLRREHARVKRVEAEWKARGLWFLIRAMPASVIGHLDQLDPQEAEEALLDALEQTFQQPEIVDSLGAAARSTPFFTEVQLSDLIDGLAHARSGDWRRAAPFLQVGLEGGLWTVYDEVFENRNHRGIAKALNHLPVSTELRVFVSRHALGGAGNPYRHGQGTDRRRHGLLVLVALVGALWELADQVSVRKEFDSTLGALGLSHLRARRTLDP